MSVHRRCNYLILKNRLKWSLNQESINTSQKVLKLVNKLLTRLRLDRSDLNSHKFTIGHSKSAECFCQAKNETSLHYLTECFLYTGERQTLYNLVEHYIPQFLNKTKHKQYDILVMGINTDQPEFNSTNTTITIAVQKFILSTKRFSETE